MLSENPTLAQAQILMAKQDYLSFLKLVDQAPETLAGEILGELYFMRAQIKLFYSDETLLEDLKMAGKLLPNGNKRPSMGTRFRTDTPNLFTIFYPEGGSLSRFKLSLHKSLPLLQKFGGDVAVRLAKLCEAEIIYFTGNFEKALAIAEPVCREATKDSAHYVSIMGGFILVRCYIALGDAEKLEAAMAQLIRYSKILSRPDYRELYAKIMGWVNCTTGWMGETPRYHITPSGVRLSVLSDRILVMNEKINAHGIFESALYRAAKHTYPEAVSMKDLYARIYEAMVQFNLGKKEQAAAIFYEVYMLTQKNRVIMPFVEYGAQILPLLQYSLSRKDSARFARRWSDKLNQMATQYEAALLVIRGESDLEKTITERLTGLEMKVLRLMVDELTIAEISESIGLPVQTIKEQFRAIYHKMHVHNRSEAIAKAKGSQIV